MMGIPPSVGWVTLNSRACSLQRSSLDRGHSACIHHPVFPCVIQLWGSDQSAEFDSNSGIVALMQSLGVVPLRAVRNNQVVAVNTRTRAATNQKRYACQRGQLVIVSLVCLLIHHYDRTQDLFSIP